MTRRIRHGYAESRSTLKGRAMSDRVIPTILYLLLGGVIALFTVVVMGDDGWYPIPLAVMLVLSTWLMNDVIVLACRHVKFVRLLFMWPFECSNRRATRDLRNLFGVMQIIVVAALVPALISWQAGNMFNDWLPQLPFERCLISCIFNEFVFMMLYPDAPSGFIVWRVDPQRNEKKLAKPTSCRPATRFRRI
jgi:hypothetical protein